jgi:hypothetical protein
MPKSRKFKLQLITKAALKRLTILAIILFALILWGWVTLFQMPSQSYTGKTLPLQPEELKLKTQLQQDIKTLATTIGPRNIGSYENLTAAKTFLETSLAESGYKVQQQEYKVKKQSYYNLIVEKRGTEKPDEIVIIGGHYDSAYTSPGANDNGTGAAATLELAKLFANKPTKRTLRFVEFTNEEPPFFWTDDMGSLVYAKAAGNSKEKIVAMLSLETMGYFSDEPASQKYPFPIGLLYPNKGNFIAFIGNIKSGDLVRKSIASFRAHTQIPSEGVVLPNGIPGVGWSDQWSFWQQGYKGIMVTDTATYRYPHYHSYEDTYDKINFDKFTKTVSGLVNVIEDLVK